MPNIQDGDAVPLLNESNIYTLERLQTLWPGVSNIIIAIHLSLYYTIEQRIAIILLLMTVTNIVYTILFIIICLTHLIILSP